MPLQDIINRQSPSALVAQIMLGAVCTRPEAEWFLAALVLEGRARAWLPGRSVADDQLPRLRMDFTRDVGWIAPRQEVIGSVPVPQRVLCTGARDDDRWRLPPDQPGETLEIDAVAVHRVLAEAAPKRRAINPAGAKPDHDWEYGCSVAWAWREGNGYPDGKLTELINHIADAMEQRSGKRPDESSVAKALRRWMRLHQNVSYS